MYSIIKDAMRKVGHEVSEGEEWGAKEIAAFRDYAHFHLGVAHDAAHSIYTFPQHFAEAWQKIIDHAEADFSKVHTAFSHLIPASAPVGTQDHSTSEPVVEMPPVQVAEQPAATSMEFNATPTTNTSATPSVTEEKPDEAATEQEKSAEDSAKE